MAPAMFHIKTSNLNTRFYSTLLESVGAQDDGEWVDVSGINPFTVHIDGLTTATMQMRGSNAPNLPDDTTHGIQLGSDIAVDGIYCVAVPIRWFKVRVVAFTSGTITAYFEGSN